MTRQERDKKRDALTDRAKTYIKEWEYNWTNFNGILIRGICIIILLLLDMREAVHEEWDD